MIGSKLGLTTFQVFSVEGRSKKRTTLGLCGSSEDVETIARNWAAERNLNPEELLVVDNLQDIFIYHPKDPFSQLVFYGQEVHLKFLEA